MQKYPFIKKGFVVASAKYDIPWGMTGGKKFKSTKSKITPLVNEMLSAFVVSGKLGAMPSSVTNDRYGNLERIKKLYDAGALTAEEFKSEKEKILMGQ